MKMHKEVSFEDKIDILMRIVNKGDLDNFGWHKVQLTQEEAIKLAGSDTEKAMTDSEVINIQLFQMRKCCERFFEALRNIGKFPASLMVILNHDMCVNIHLNLPNEEKYNFTSQDCSSWITDHIN